jgi:hypothetical protein
MVLDMFRAVRHLAPQYLADNVHEAECAHLLYRTRLSRLHISDTPLAITFLRGGHLATWDPK